MADWSPNAYLKFEAQRTRPARDLLAQVPLGAPRRIVDMGCGPGNSTQLLVARFPDAEVIGLDRSPAMLAEARGQVPGARFEAADGESWTPGPGTDLVFANAVYQWIPDHIVAFKRILAALEPGGVLAVQMPNNAAEPSHTLMGEVAAAGPWATRLGGAARAPLASVRTYHEALAPQAGEVEIWETRYIHALANAEAILEWFKSTGLRPFLDPLDEAEGEAFRARYVARLTEAYPATSTGPVLLGFPRLFIVAQKEMA